MQAKPSNEESRFVTEKLATMDLRQKIGQMTMPERMHITTQDITAHGFGSVLSGGGSHPGDNSPLDWVKMNDEYWQAVMESSAGIPLLFGVDAVHGHNNVKGATIFPHNLALGAIGDPALVKSIAAITGKEVLASGLEWSFAPTLAVVQNCQWGRTYESFGCDPVKNGELGRAFVEGMQGAGAMACAKHWVGDGGTCHGIDQGETTVDWQTLQATHISPYLPVLEAGVMTVMVSFNSWNGEKCHGNHFLITEYLKQELGFAGIVVSDWDGIDYLDADYDTAIAKAANAGLDIFMVPERWREFMAGLERHVNEGRVPMSRIDDAVSRILLTKLRYGLFELPRPAERKTAATDPGIAEEFGSVASRSIAREAVRRSLVLLKDEGALPLTGQERILVAGKNANNLGHQCGGWTISWQGERDNTKIQGTSVWQGIKAQAPGAVLSANLDGAEADTKEHDLAIVVIGEFPYAEGMGDVRSNDQLLVEAGSMINGLMNPLEPYSRSLELAQVHPEDLQCIKRIADAGVPVVTVLVSGRPMVINRELDSSSAFVAAWLPGTEGDGLAEVLFGKAEFEGRLPLPWPAADPAPGEEQPKTLFEVGYGLKAGEGVARARVA